MMKTSKLKLERVPTSLIKLNGYTIRRKLSTDLSLRKSLKKHGQLTPLLVLEDYTLVCGFRRYKELKALAARNLWVIKICGLKKNDILLYQLTELLHTQQLNPIEKGRAYKKLQDKLHISKVALSKILNVPKTDVAYHIRMLTLPKNIKDEIFDKKIRAYSYKMDLLIGR